MKRILCKLMNLQQMKYFDQQIISQMNLEFYNQSIFTDIGLDYINFR
jgi:hypothetical protein